jgi:DNA-binding transcriptional LysR family regulator
MIALPEKYHLASRKTIPLRALAAEPYVMFSRNIHRDYHDQIIDSFRSAGATLHVVHEADTIHTMRILVGAGLDVSVLPAFSQTDKRFRIAFRKIKGLPPAGSYRSHIAVTRDVSFWSLS